MLWGKLPEDVVGSRRGWGIEKFAEILFSDTRHVRLFNTK